MYYSSTVEPSSSEGEKVGNPNRTLSEKIQNIVDKFDEAEKNSNTERNQHFAKELAVFELTKVRINNLSKLHKALKSVPQKIVEAERGFSAAGLFITKHRSRLNGKSK